MKDRDRLTIIIPSSRRPEYLKRSIAFWLSAGVRVIVCEEGTSPSWLPADFTQPTSNLDYRVSMSAIEERLLESTSSVTTDYCMWTSDDEFVLPETLDIGMSLLDSKQWVGCSGRTLGFSWTGKKVQMRPVYTPTSILEDSPCVRLRSCFAHYGEPLLWNLYRTEVLLRSSQVMAAHKFSVGAPSELLHAATISVQGRVGAIDRVLRLRSQENKNQWNPYSSRTPRLKDWCKERVDERESWIDAVAGVFTPRDANTSTARLCAEDALSAKLESERARSDTSKAFSRRLASLIVPSSGRALLKSALDKAPCGPKRQLTESETLEIKYISGLVSSFHLTSGE